MNPADSAYAFSRLVLVGGDKAAVLRIQLSRFSPDELSEPRAHTALREKNGLTGLKVLL